MPKSKQTAKKRVVTLKETTIHMGLFDYSVVVCIGKYEEMGEYIRHKFDDNTFDLEASNMGYEPRGKTFFRRGYVPVIWIPRKPRTAREHATFAHEALHAVFHLFEWVDLPVNRDTEEVMTHSMAHIIANITYTP